MTSSPCIKRCVCWEFLDKRCGNVSSAARSKLFTSDADAKKACASRSSALNPTSSIKLHKLGCSMKHHPSISTSRRPPRRRAPAAQPVHFLDGIDPAAAGPIAISAILKVRLEDRFQHQLGGGLNP